MKTEGRTVTQYVGYSRRASALFIDSIWWTLLTLFIPVGPSIDTMTDIASLFSMKTLFWVVVVQCIPLIVTGVMWAVWGTSPGKHALGLRIVDAETGYRMTARQAAIRTLGYIVCFSTLGIGFLWMFFNARKQGPHDYMAGTVVVESTRLNEATFSGRRF